MFYLFQLRNGCILTSLLERVAAQFHCLSSNSVYIVKSTLNIKVEITITVLTPLAGCSMEGRDVQAGHIHCICNA